MIRLVARRLGWTIVVAWFAMTATFVMVAAIPADPVLAILGPHKTPEAIARVREHYCLDRGPLVQYGCYVGHIVRGDLGDSYRTKRPVAEILVSRIGPTIELALAAIVLQRVFGAPLGVLAAIRRGRWPDRGATLVGLLGQSAPTFFVGTLALYVFAFQLGWLPFGGYGVGVIDRLRHLVLPAATLAAFGIGYYARIVRTEMIDVLDADYVRTARAKGLRERRVVFHHALRNALGPLVALIGLDLGFLLGGAVVVEGIFAWPGLGREIMQAVLEVDIPVILGVVVMSAIAIALVNLAADVIVLALDPRLRDE